MTIPVELRDAAERGPDWADWLDRLPRLLRDLLAEWELTVDGDSMSGYCSLVVPVRTKESRPAALKVGFVEDESEHEHLALRHWQGRGAVELLRADPRRGALLLERLDTRDLRDLGDVEACEVVAGLYGRLHIPAPPQLRTLTSYVETWSARLAGLPRDAPLPHRLVDQAVSLTRDLVSDSDSVGTLIHTDLHYENVLAGEREPWLAIDPKPVSGDPHYELAPMLWNRFEELAGDVRDGLRRRFHTLVDAAGLHEERARDWVIVRMMHNAMWTLEDARRAARALTVEDRDWVTCCITVAKGVQD